MKHSALNIEYLKSKACERRGDGNRLGFIYRRFTIVTMESALNFVAEFEVIEVM